LLLMGSQGSSNPLEEVTRVQLSPNKVHENSDFFTATFAARKTSMIHDSATSEKLGTRKRPNFCISVSLKNIYFYRYTVLNSVFIVLFIMFYF
jgi:hypothetical protein